MLLTPITLNQVGIHLGPISFWKPIFTLLEKGVLAVSPDGKNFTNLSFEEPEALKELKSDRSIVIKEADKGSAIVVWDREDYVTEANRQLSNLEVYEALDWDPTVELEAEVRN